MRHLATILFVLLMAGSAVAATLSEPETDPVGGKEISLSLVEDNGLPGVAYEVKALYRKNAHETLQSTQEIGVTDLAGVVTWTPTQPGVVELSWSKEGVEDSAGSQNISVLHDGFPPLAILIAVFAGLLLLGGSVLFFLQMVREQKPPAGRELPST